MHTSQDIDKKKEYESEVDLNDDDEEEIQGHYTGDENTERGNWGGHMEFILSVVGYCVGLGNLWRFPYLAYKNGGGAFLIPYWCVALLIGYPLTILELSIGQFASSGPTTCWRFAPILAGCGYAAIILIAIVSLYYNVIISWTLFYLFASFTSELPWEFCLSDRAYATWTTELCNLPINVTCETEQGSDVEFNQYDNGTCYMFNRTTTNSTEQGEKLYGLWNATLANENGIKPKLPSEEYFYNYLLGETPGVSSFENPGQIRWQNVLCLLLGWIIVYICLINGIKSAGKVVYFSAIFPYVGLIILLVRGLTLEGGGGTAGALLYITPDFERLKDQQVWVDAAVQVFYSLGPAWGSLFALASYNKFHTNTVRDSLIAVLADSGTSLLAGFTVFTYLGYFADKRGVPILEVAESGPALAFVVYPAALTLLPVSPAWSVLFFFTLLFIGLDSSFNMVEGILTGVLDKYPIFRQSLKHKASIFAVICIILFLLSLPQVMQGGEYITNYLVVWTGGWPLLFIALFECVGVCYIYGFRRFSKDIRCMVPWFDGWIVYVLGSVMCVLTPLVITTIIIINWIDTAKSLEPGGIKDRKYAYPRESSVAGVFLQLFQISPIIIIALWRLFVGWRAGDMMQAFRPTYDWGPALVKHRKLVDYVDGFIVNPRRYREEQKSKKLSSDEETTARNRISYISSAPPPSYQQYELA